MSESLHNWVLFAGVFACAIDTIVLGVISQDRFRGRFRAALTTALVIGLSHCLFACLGMLIHAAYVSAFGEMGDYFVIAIAVAIVVVGGTLSQAPNSKSGSVIAAGLLGLDAAPLGSCVAFMGTLPTWFLPACFGVPATVFLLSLLAAFRGEKSGKEICVRASAARNLGKLVPPVKT